MLRIDAGATPRYCDGVSRRSFVQIGVAGMASVGLPEILKARAQAVEGGTPRKETSVILIWIDGGPSHMDLYDLKPEAPSDYAGIWRPIRTNVPGMEISPLFPLQAKVADKFSIVRSLHHNRGGHFDAGHWMLTGHGGVNGSNNAGKYPSIGSIATKVLGSRKSGMPAYVGVPYGMSIGLRPGYFGANYLGVHHNPFEVGSDPNSRAFHVKNMTLPTGLTIKRLDDRRALMKGFDTLRRDADHTGMIASMDRFNQQAFDLVTGPIARKAFDINAEDPKLRDRYGRNSWGQSTLLARRLVEAGSTFVSCHYGGWDHHWNLESGMKSNLPRVDSAVSTLFEDLETRGLSDQVLVVICGEFSRTPKMNNGGNGGAPLSKGTPGRDHWGNAMFCILAGGGLKGGQIVGSTNAKGEVPQDRPLRPGDLHHTIYHVLGVDPNTQFLNHSGRPVAAIDHGEVIRELV